MIDKSCTSYGSVPCQDVTEALPQSNLTCRHTKVQSEPLKIIHFKRALTRAILLQLSESYILRNRNKFNRSDKRKKKYSLLATHDRAIATLVFVRCSSFIPSPKYGRQGNKSDVTCTQSSSFSSIQSPFFLDSFAFESFFATSYSVLFFTRAVWGPPVESTTVRCCTKLVVKRFELEPPEKSVEIVET